MERVLESYQQVIFTLNQMFQTDSFLGRSREGYEQRKSASSGVAGSHSRLVDP